MKLGNEILTNAYKLLKVSALTNVISGNVYKGNVNPKSNKEDVEINLLTNSNKYVQNGYVNVNVYVPNIQNRTNIKRIDLITEIIVSLIDNKKTENNAFQIENQSGYIQDETRDMMSFVNLKINFQIL